MNLEPVIASEYTCSSCDLPNIFRFVNISPADYNASETVTSLDYASRVKEIKNTGTKDQEGAEVHRLKDIIKRLKAGEDVEDDEILKAE